MQFSIFWDTLMAESDGIRDWISGREKFNLLRVGVPSCFRATVHGTVFGERVRNLERVRPGDELVLVPGPPTDDPPGVWVHLPGGDVVGHMPPEIELWLAPWMLTGGRVTARAIKVEGDDAPSWRRLLIEVTCAGVPTSS